MGRTPLLKPITRRAILRGRVFNVELSVDGVSFRELHRRFKVTAPLELTLQLAERIAGEELRRLRLAARRHKQQTRGR